MTTYTYQIIVKFDSNVVYMTYIKAPVKHEEILRDFVYQQLQAEQPDISKYEVLNMESNPNAFIEFLLGQPKKVTLQNSLANKLAAYADKYQ